MGALNGLLKPFRGLAITAVVLACLAIASNMALMGFSAWIIAAAGYHPPLAALSLAIIGVRFSGISRAVCRYGERLVSHHVTFRILAALRSRVYQAVEKQPLINQAKGDIWSRMFEDVATLEFYYLRVLSPLVVAILLLVLLFGFAWLLGMLPVFGILLLLLAVEWLGITKLVKVKQQSVLAGRKALSICTADAIFGLNELNAWGRKILQSSLAAAVNRVSKAEQKYHFFLLLGQEFTQLGRDVLICMLLIVLIPKVRSGSLDSVMLPVCILAAASSFEAFLALVQAAIYKLRCTEAIQSLQELETVSKMEMPGSQSQNRSSKAYLEVKNLTYAYSQGEKVLNGINFSLRQGEHVAVVGSSGSGKSTLISLLTDMAGVYEGEIWLAGKELRQCNPESWRQNFAVVNQEVHIFEASLRDNLLLANRTAKAKELQAAMAFVKLGDWQENRRLDRFLGLGGTLLSGGEKRRVALARALLKSAPVWLLDEPTVGLDPKTAGEIMDDLLVNLHNQSLLLITHQVDLLAHPLLDRIIVLDQGRIVEEGTFTELIQKQERFWSFWMLEKDLLKDIK